MAVRNADRLSRKLQQLTVEARAGIGKALAVSVVELDASAKDKIQGGGRSGRIYRRRTVTHQASAPGEFPKTDRGQLVASLFFQVAGDRLSAVFGSKLGYARALEYGTSRMAPRPWLRPTFRTFEPQARQRIRDAVRAAVRSAGG